MFKIKMCSLFWVNVSISLATYFDSVHNIIVNQQIPQKILNHSNSSYFLLWSVPKSSKFYTFPYSQESCILRKVIPSAGGGGGGKNFSPRIL